MDKQIKYLVGILVLFIIAMYFLNLFAGLPQFFKDDIIAFLEEKSQADIAFESVSLWPLNRLRLTGFRYQDQSGNSFKADELSFNYSLSFFTDKLLTINFMELKKADLNLINVSPFLQNNNLNKESSSSNLRENPEEIADNFALPNFLTGLRLNIVDSNFEINLPDYKLQLERLNMGLNISSPTDFTADLTTALKIDQLKLPDQIEQPKELKNISLDKLDLSFTKQDQQSKLYFATADFKLQDMVAQLEHKIYNYQNLSTNLEELTGNAALQGEIKFDGLRLINYNSELDLTNLAATAAYNYQTGTEAEQSVSQAELQPVNQSVFNLEIPQLKLFISGPKLAVAFKKTNFILANNPLEIAFKLKADSEFEFTASASSFSADYPFLEKYFKQLNFDFRLAGKGKKNELTQATAEVKVNQLTNELFDLEEGIFKLRFVQNKLYLDQGHLLMSNQGEIDLKGSYNLQQENYLLQLKTAQFVISNKLKTEILNFKPETEKYLNQLERIKDNKLNFSAKLAGLYGKNNALSAAGNLDFNFALADSSELINLNSSFWYAQQNLIFNQLQFKSNSGYLDLMGEINFAANSLNLRYAGQNIEADLVKDFYPASSQYLADFKPNIAYLQGSISQQISDPLIKLSFKTPYWEYQGYQLRNIVLKSSYQADQVKIRQLTADLNQAVINVSGQINNLSAGQEAELALQLESEDLYFEDIAKFIQQPLPLSGEISLKAKLNSKLSQPNIQLEVKADNSSLIIAENEFDFSNLKLNLTGDGSSFRVDKFSVQQKNVNLTAAGEFSLNNGFELDFNLEPFILNDYSSYLGKNFNNIKGQLNITGRVKGPLLQPEFDFNIDSQNLEVFGFKANLQNTALNFRPNSRQLQLEEFDFELAGGDYSLQGDLVLADQLQTNLNLQLKRVPIQQLAEQYLNTYPLAEPVFLQGETAIKGTGLSVTANLNLTGQFPADSKSSFSVEGQLGQGMSVKLAAKDLPLNLVSDRTGFKLDLQSRLDFTGELTGSLQKPVFKLNNQLTELTLNSSQLESIKGNLVINDSEHISVEQEIKFKSAGSLLVAGSYGIQNQSLDFSSDLNSLPISFLLSFLDDDFSSDGNLDGSLTVAGTIAKPELDGNLDLTGNNLAVGLSDPIRNYQGHILFSEENIKLEAITGDFVDGDFRLDGTINLAELDQAWQLNLTGHKLYFSHGSLEGLFDTELEFKGPLLRPVLRGQLDLYDFVVGIPFKWSDNSDQQSADQQNSADQVEVNQVETAQETEQSFQPALDLQLNPTDNVRVKSDNIDVLVQDGSVRLSYYATREKPFAMEGRLSSDRGVFNYYSSRFELINGEAIFTPLDENSIPTLRVNAETYAGGREININLNGPANNMRMTFSSTPEMTQEEILNLLSSQGALGSAVIGGEDIGIQTIIFQELIRLVNSSLQKDVISDLETNFRSALSLDRIEIDTYNYGVDREFAIYLGKNLSDKFYLEYASYFNEDGREGEISFEYKLNQISVLKGSYLGDNDYQISIESEIEF